MHIISARAELETWKNDARVISVEHLCARFVYDATKVSVYC